jgi:hypothetical protein
MVDYIIQATILAIIMFWLLNNAAGFNAVATAARETVVGSARALWGQ